MQQVAPSFSLSSVDVHCENTFRATLHEVAVTSSAEGAAAQDELIAAAAKQISSKEA